MHRRRLCHIVIDVTDLDAGVAFWAAALGACEEPIDAGSTHIYRRLRLPGNTVRLLLQLVPERTQAKSPVHLDLEADDVEAEVRRLEALGARRVRLEQERGHRFWVMADPFGNDLCVLEPEFPDLLAAEGSGRVDRGDDRPAIPVREATDADAEAIARVHVRTWQHAYRGLLPRELLDGLDAADRAAMWRRATQPRNPTRVRVAVDEHGAVTGFVATGPDRDDDRRGELYAIYVDPEAQGHGYGAALLEAGHADLAARGYPEAVLWVLDGNDRTIRFYEAAGWRFDGEQKREELGGAEAVEWRMRRALDPEATHAGLSSSDHPDT